jgi:hypothetical protein
MDQNFLLRGAEILVVGRHSVRNALRRISSCELCNPLASTLFKSVLDEVLDRSSGATNYFIDERATCPSCARPIIQSTFVDFVAASDLDSQETAFNPPFEETNIVLVNESQLREAQACIIACESCSDGAEISFDYLLDAVSGCDPSTTEYLMPHPVHCPRCFRKVTEKTLVVPE